MKLELLLISVLAATAACHHDTKPTSPTNDVASGNAMVDPTMPSWAPKSCLAYHTAVVRFVACDSMDVAARESAKTAYEAKNKEWHDMQNLPQGAIEEVGATCANDEAAVNAQIDPSCPGTTTKPTASL